MPSARRVIALGCLVASFACYGCGVTEWTFTNTTYAKTRKSDRDTTAVFHVPKLELPEGTQETQVKGDVAVTCRLEAFSAERDELQRRTVTYVDPGAPGFDQYETEIRPIYRVGPAHLEFSIVVRNNQDRVLKLIDVPIIVLADGDAVSIPDSTLLEWKAGLIVKGFEKTFPVQGPTLEQLLSEERPVQSLYIAIHDVPTLYDRAGNVTAKDNFEWTYRVLREAMNQPDQIRYAYDREPVRTETCSQCSGKGKVKVYSKCSLCSGSGTYTNKKGKAVKCYGCEGTGQSSYSTQCDACGGAGTLSYPQSPAPPVAHQEVWTGWDVRVETTPPGAQVKVVDPRTGEYTDKGISNLKVRWYSLPGRASPIVVASEGKSVRVLPYSGKGKKASKVVIDFGGNSEPVVLVGETVK